MTYTTGITGNHKIASIVKNRIIQFLPSTLVILLSNSLERQFRELNTESSKSAQYCCSNALPGNSVQCMATKSVITAVIASVIAKLGIRITPRIVK